MGGKAHSGQAGLLFVMLVAMVTGLRIAAEEVDRELVGNAHGEPVASVGQDHRITLHTLPWANEPQPAPSGAPDDDLERGFPVQTSDQAGSYHGGPAIHTLVGNIDFDPRLEIIVTALARGPIYAWHHNGSRVRGWPVPGPAPGDGAGYPVLAKLTKWPFLSVFVGFCGDSMAAYHPGGWPLPGWPQPSANYVSTPAASADVVRVATMRDRDIDELFLGEEDWLVHGYDSSGQALDGWPRAFVTIGKR